MAPRTVNLLTNCRPVNGQTKIYSLTFHLKYQFLGVNSLPNSLSGSTLGPCLLDPSVLHITHHQDCPGRPLMVPGSIAPISPLFLKTLNRTFMLQINCYAIRTRTQTRALPLLRRFSGLPLVRSVGLARRWASETAVPGPTAWAEWALESPQPPLGVSWAQEPPTGALVAHATAPAAPLDRRSSLHRR